jgi:signal transduction histidine kinase
MALDGPPDAPRRAQLRAVATAFLRRRPWVVAPALALQTALLAQSDAPRAQVAAVLGGFTAVLSFFAWESWRGRTALVSERGFLGSLLVTLAGISLGALGTGAIGSPLLPLLFAPTVVGFAAFGRAAPGRALVVALVVALAALWAMPVGVPFPPLPTGTARAMALVAALTALALLRVGVSSLSDAYADAGDALAGAGDELIAGAEARHHAMEALGAQVAHEIKNPLTAIKGLADLLAEQAERPEDRLRLEVMGGEVARIEGILRDYLSFSRPLGEVARAPVDVAEALRSFEALLGHRAERAGVALSFDGAPLRAALDPRRVKEAVLNLALNALDATARGGSVRVSWAVEAERVVVTVDDTGGGMSEAVAARAGEGFFTTRDGGTGLGVALARRVATEHGGSLTYETAPGRGTRARLDLGAREGAPA